MLSGSFCPGYTFEYNLNITVHNTYTTHVFFLRAIHIQHLLGTCTPHIRFPCVQGTAKRTREPPEHHSLDEDDDDEATQDDPDDEVGNMCGVGVKCTRRVCMSHTPREWLVDDRDDEYVPPPRWDRPGEWSDATSNESDEEEDTGLSLLRTCVFAV